MNFYLRGEDISRGRIQHIHCSTCGFESSKFEITGDSWAMNFLGIVGLTSISKKEIVLTHLTKEEFQNFKDVQGLAISKRINDVLNRTDLVFIKRALNQQNKVDFLCPQCDNIINTVGEETMKDYVDSGGQILCLDIYKK